MSDFSCRLKELRLENKLTQKQLAEKMNVSQTAIALWERGKREPDFYTLELLSNFFHVDVDYLLGREKNSPKVSPLLTVGNCEIFLDKQGKNPDKQSERLLHFFNYFLKNKYTKDELEEIQQYAEFVKSKRKTPVLNAAHDNGATPDQKKNADDIMKNSDEWN